MAKTINDLEILQAYIRGVISRADHHANDVDEIALALVGIEVPSLRELISGSPPFKIQVGTARALFLSGLR